MHVSVRSIPGLLVTATVVVLAGCAGVSDPTGLFKSEPGATPPPASGSLAVRPAEGGPAAPTAVVESSFTLDGVILPVTRGQTRTETRAEMRRSDSAVTFDNWLVRRFAGDGQSSDIVRVDRRLVWTLDPARQTYLECPITGCPVTQQETSKEPRPDRPAAPKEPTCPLTVRTNDVKVDATGERRTVANFPTERYQVVWTVELEDGSGRRQANRVRTDLWTTAETGAVRDVKAINDAFEARYMKAASRGEGPVGGYLPPQVTAAMGLLMTHAGQAASRWAAEMRKVRGYPVATTMTWTVEGAVCTDAGAGQPSPGAAAAGIGGMLGGLFGGRKADGTAAPTPLITYSHEVRSLTVSPVADAVFVPPPAYRRSN